MDGNIVFLHRRVATGQEILREEKFFYVREKSGNSSVSQRKFAFEKKEEKTMNFQSRLLSYVFLFEGCSQTRRLARCDREDGTRDGQAKTEALARSKGKPRSANQAEAVSSIFL